jgi:hypothetical protein
VATTSQAATTTLLADYVGLGLVLDAFDDLRTPTADGSKKPGGKVGGSPSILLTPGGGISRVAEAIYVNNNIGGGTQSSEANIHYGQVQAGEIGVLERQHYQRRISNSVVSAPQSKRSGWSCCVIP